MHWPKPKLPWLSLPRIKIRENAIREVFQELCLVAGFFIFGYGIWLVYQPAAFIVCGFMLMLLGFPARPSNKGGG